MSDSCNPTDCSPPGSSVHGILQARILEWVAISFSKGSFWPRDRTRVSCITGRFFTFWATRKTPLPVKHVENMCYQDANHTCLFQLTSSVLRLFLFWNKTAEGLLLSWANFMSSRWCHGKSYFWSRCFSGQVVYELCWHQSLWRPQPWPIVGAPWVSVIERAKVQV